MELIDPIFPFFEDHRVFHPDMRRMTDIHLYTGSFCNRSCDFCIVYGDPRGWYRPLFRTPLELVLKLIESTGNIKFYGGEPTLDHENILWAIQYLRSRGFSGWFTVFSNGIQSRRIVEFLDFDPRVEVTLNYSILHGKGAEAIPSSDLSRLQRYENKKPGRIFSSHPDLVPIGQGFEKRFSAREDFGGACARCRPVITSKGKVHACPFAVEFDRPHYDLGDTNSPEDRIQENYRAFLDWVDQVLEPEAERRKIHPCRVCHKHLQGLPTYVNKACRVQD
jgi:MoaA/NifB/PqqE/SkfB family radical SAM enzyme